MKVTFSLKKTAVSAVLGLVSLVVVLDGYGTTDAGFTYVVQDTLFGTYRTYDEPGIFVKVPFFAKITAYKQAVTINFGIVNADEGTAKFTRSLHPLDVAYADTYEGKVYATFRFRIPRGREDILRIHQEFRSFGNLVDALLVKNARSVAVVTATQFTGEEFFLGGVNSYKVAMMDQLSRGLYLTERKQVTLDVEDVDEVSQTQANASELITKPRKVWKNVTILDENGNPKRSTSPLGRYGIEITQVTLGRPIPHASLNNLLEGKRTLVAKRIASIEEFNTAEAESRTVQQTEQIEKNRQTQIALRVKALAEIAAQQEVAVARQEALLILVRKNRDKDAAVVKKAQELAIAEADRDIQAAAAEAAVFQARAIEAVGLAKANVLEAMFLAKISGKEVYLAEIQKEIAQVMYPALKDITIDMPDYYNAGGNGDGSMTTSLDIYTTLGAMKMLQATPTTDTPVRLTNSK